MIRKVSFFSEKKGEKCGKYKIVQALLAAVRIIAITEEINKLISLEHGSFSISFSFFPIYAEMDVVVENPPLFLKDLREERRFS